MCKWLSLVHMARLEEQVKKERDSLSMRKNWVQVANIARKATDNHQRPAEDHQLHMHQGHLHILMSYEK